MTDCALLTPDIIGQLEANWAASQADLEQDPDHRPVVKFFAAGCTWLITEKKPGTDTLFGLCDLGMGYPELGYVNLSDLESIMAPGCQLVVNGIPRGRAMLRVERDPRFEADRPLSVYADEAEAAGRIKA